MALSPMAGAFPVLGRPPAPSTSSIDAGPRAHAPIPFADVVRRGGRGPLTDRLPDEQRLVAGCLAVAALVVALARHLVEPAHAGSDGPAGAALAVLQWPASYVQPFLGVAGAVGVGVVAVRSSGFKRLGHRDGVALAVAVVAALLGTVLPVVVLAVTVVAFVLIAAVAVALAIGLLVVLFGAMGS